APFSRCAPLIAGRPDMRRAVLTTTKLNNSPTPAAATSGCTLTDTCGRVGDGTPPGEYSRSEPKMKQTNPAIVSPPCAADLISSTNRAAAPRIRTIPPQFIGSAAKPTNAITRQTTPVTPGSSAPG